jgi:hypothetical protein
MLALSTIVYADIDPTVSPQPSAVANSIKTAAKDSLSAGQFQIVQRQLSLNDVRQAVQALPVGHDHLAPDDNLILLDAGAMIAYAPYRGRVILTTDPFSHTEAYAETLGVDVDVLRVRLHDALLSAEKVVALDTRTFDAILPLLPFTPEKKNFPATPLRSSHASGAGILVVGNDDPDSMKQVMAVFEREFPAEKFVAYDAGSVFERSWKMVLHLGLIRELGLGARLADAWSGGVPVLQCVDPARLDAYRRRQHQAVHTFVEHGKTGLLFPTMEELIRALRELISDSLPARSVARGARHRVDPAAEWDALFAEILL